MSRTIKLKKYIDIIDERQASADILPGMIIEYESNGKIKPHSSAGAKLLTAIATEDELQGKTIRDNYSADEPVQIWIPNRGEQAQCILAAGQNVSVVTALTSNGDGKLKAAGVDDFHVAIALNAVNATAADQFIKVMFY